jgi:hypothetical protein
VPKPPDPILKYAQCAASARSTDESAQAEQQHPIVDGDVDDFVAVKASKNSRIYRGQEGVCSWFHTKQLQPTNINRFQQAPRGGSGPGGRRFKSSLPDHLWNQSLTGFLSQREILSWGVIRRKHIAESGGPRSLDRTDLIGFSLAGLAPDGSPLASLIRSDSDIFALDLDLP